MICCVSLHCANLFILRQMMHLERPSSGSHIDHIRRSGTPAGQVPAAAIAAVKETVSPTGSVWCLECSGHARWQDQKGTTGDERWCPCRRAECSNNRSYRDLSADGRADVRVNGDRVPAAGQASIWSWSQKVEKHKQLTSYSVSKFLVMNSLQTGNERRLDCKNKVIKMEGTPLKITSEETGPQWNKLIFASSHSSAEVEPGLPPQSLGPGSDASHIVWWCL